MIADHFTQISQEFRLLSLENLTPEIFSYINMADSSSSPRLNAAEVYARIRKTKKPNSQVKGDLHPKLVKVYAETLAEPITQIYNNIVSTSVYPSLWKVEHQVPIPKQNMPETEEHLRNISKTPFFSKVFESFIGEWLMNVIKPYFDPGQCGVKGSSITHYLIQFLHFVLSNLDERTPHAVLAAYLDLSKAFNRVDHLLVIQDLYDMHTPPWLLRIMVSYLSGRKMILTYNGITSDERDLFAGGPQGAFLGGLIFMIKFNGALMRPKVPRPMTRAIAQSKSKSIKYVDDGSVAVSIDLKTSLTKDPVDRIRPHTYNERQGYCLPAENNLLQYFILDAEEFTQKNKMVINTSKTNAMLFNRCKKWVFPPELQFEDESPIELVNETKLLGLIITSDLKWNQNTIHICQKARRKLWILRRLKSFNLEETILFDVYTKEIRSIVELAVPVWHSSLTVSQSNSIEQVQKLSFKIILGNQYNSYPEAIQFFGTSTLKERRLTLCKKFALKNVKSDKSLFKLCDLNSRTRSKRKVHEFKCNTTRFERSSLPFLAKLINQS